VLWREKLVVWPWHRLQEEVALAEIAAATQSANEAMGERQLEIKSRSGEVLKFWTGDRKPADWAKLINEAAAQTARA
jgi:hypothetical protein